MAIRHKRHLEKSMARKEHKEHHEEHHEEGKKRKSGGRVPELVSGNKNVVEEAKSTKSIGKVPGIWSKKRLDREPRKMD